MPTIKGTASIASNAAQNKLLRSTKFPASFSTSVDLTKVNTAVMSQWIEKQIETMLGFEDEIVASMAINLFFPKLNEDTSATASSTDVKYAKVDPRRAQLDLVGFLGDEDAAKFASQLWEMLIDAQEQPQGIPQKLIEEKKKEMNIVQVSENRQHSRPTSNNGENSRAGGRGNTHSNYSSDRRYDDYDRRRDPYSSSNRSQNQYDYHRQNNQNYSRGRDDYQGYRRRDDFDRRDYRRDRNYDSGNYRDHRDRDWRDRSRERSSHYDSYGRRRRSRSRESSRGRDRDYARDSNRGRDYSRDSSRGRDRDYSRSRSRSRGRRYDSRRSSSADSRSRHSSVSRSFSRSPSRERIRDRDRRSSRYSRSRSRSHSRKSRSSSSSRR
ncbi:serine/arginine repetitive matrix protein 1 [Chaetoceros tenuissimus]|uniref:Serine/arginine repetitive matrix protein 1 n=1 Tax=Chaetoceros tenuissimus TaxID=426638 RepID=A0AAD3CIY8_9STRA|nr:serine/arginine repetitive matrix protein 1 [Chaetoceros tenuissimus]